MGTNFSSIQISILIPDYYHSTNYLIDYLISRTKNMHVSCKRSSLPSFLCAQLYQEHVTKSLRKSCLISLLSFLDLNPFKPNGFFHSYYLEKSILHFRGVRLIFSSLA